MKRRNLRRFLKAWNEYLDEVEADEAALEYDSSDARLISDTLFGYAPDKVDQIMEDKTNE